jgi:type I restriction enzyme R subunit
MNSTARRGQLLGREHKGQVVPTSRLRPVLERLNPDLWPEAIDLAIEELTRERGLMRMAQANREIYDLIKHGVTVKLPDDEGEGEAVESVRVIDWNNPLNNDFLLASQFWAAGEMYTQTLSDSQWTALTIHRVESHPPSPRDGLYW